MARPFTNILLFVLVLLLLPISANASIFYIRDGGGSVYGTSTATNTCNGQTNVVYSIGASPNCALNHPRLVLGYCTGNESNSDVPPCQVAGHMVAGDTMNINGDSDINAGQQAQYQMNYDDINTSTVTPSCNTSFAYACNTGPVPNGATSSSKTMVIGTGTHQPQLWGNEGGRWVMYLVPPLLKSSGTFTRTTGAGDSSITYSASYGQTYFFTVSGVSVPPSVGDTYQNVTSSGTFTFTIRSLVLSGGAGTIVMSLSSFSNLTPTGTLTRATGSGDATLTYSAKTFSAKAVLVSGVTTAPLAGDTYTTNGATFDVIGTNISSGSGTIGLNTEENVDMENLEITQHSSCSYVVNGVNPSNNGYPSWCGGTGGSYPFGPDKAHAGWAKWGVWLEGSNITTKNLWVHNISDALMNYTGNIGNYSDTNSRYEAAGDFLTDSSTGIMTFSGNNLLNGDVWAFGGCQEIYPPSNLSNVKNPANYINCVDQNGGGLGGGFANQYGSFGPCGNWKVENSQFYGNLKSNFDMLHCDGTGTMNAYRNRSESSLGESWKLNFTTDNFEENQFISNAPIWTTSAFQSIKAPYDQSGANWYFTTSGITTPPSSGDTYTNNGVTFTIKVVTFEGSAGVYQLGGASTNGTSPTSSGTLTRTAGAGDVTISFSSSFGWLYLTCRGHAGIAVYFTNTSGGESLNLVNNDITGNCTALIELQAFQNTCSGASINSNNNKYVGGYAYDVTGQQVDLFYNGGSDGNGGGNCGVSGGNTLVPFNQSHDSCFNAHTLTYSGCSFGTNTITSDPKIIGEQSTALTSLLGSTAYYAGQSFGDLFYLQGTSPLVGAGSTSGVTYTNGTSNDYNNITANSPITIGAIQTGSCVSTSTGMTNGFCSNSQCCTGSCSGEGMCVANSPATTTCQWYGQLVGSLN